jgi:pyridoxine 4-dehydrogenase
MPLRSIAHLEENIGAGDVVLEADAIARLDAIYDRATDPLADSNGIEAFLDEVR